MKLIWQDGNTRTFREVPVYGKYRGVQLVGKRPTLIEFTREDLIQVTRYESPEFIKQWLLHLLTVLD
jgi:hypothetical protein